MLIIIDQIMAFWYRAQDAIQSATAVIVIIGGIAGIFGIMFFSMFKLKKLSKHLAILVSVVLSCILMIPVISSFNNFVRIRIEGTIIDEARAEIRAQRAEAARMRAENMVKTLEQTKLENQLTIARQTIEVQTLNDSMKQLEDAQLSMQSFQRILELALLETNLKQTLVRKDTVSEIRGLGILGYNYDEVLAIIDLDITAKYGIDLNGVRVAKINENTVVVSGIQPKYIATSRYIPQTILSEFRRVNWRGGERRGGILIGGDVDTVNVQNDRDSIQRASQLTNDYRTDFERRLSAGTELGFMDDAVTQLAQNFITVMLTPIYGNNINFDNAYRPDALPVMEYLERELRETNVRRLRLNEANRNLDQVNEQLENEIRAIEYSSSIEDGEIP